MDFYRTFDFIVRVQKEVIPINSFLLWINFGVILEHTSNQTNDFLPFYMFFFSPYLYISELMTVIGVTWETE